MTEESKAEGAPARRWLWRLAWLVIAAAYAWPVASIAYERVQQVMLEARVRLIVQHSLWELHPEYGGTPDTWTRFASRLLTDRQLMLRVRAKYGALSEQIELDYRRDLFVAQGEILAVAVLAWGLPLAALYGIGYVVARRRSRRPLPAPPPPTDDSRYRA